MFENIYPWLGVHPTIESLATVLQHCNFLPVFDSVCMALLAVIEMKFHVSFIKRIQLHENHMEYILNLHMYIRNFLSGYNCLIYLWCTCMYNCIQLITPCVLWVRSFDEVIRQFAIIVNRYRLRFFATFN